MMVLRAPMRDVTRFNPGCLIGNWSEDRELQRSILKELLAQRVTGTTRLDMFQTRMQTCLHEVELTKVADDGYVHFGEILQVVHVDTGCVLAGDPSAQDLRPGEDACAATASPQVRAPCHRNALILLPYKSPRPAHVLEPEYADSVVHYGQKVRVALHPGASGQPLDRAGGPHPYLLFSKPISTTHAAKYSRQQLVGFTLRDSFDTVFQVVTPDPSMRALSEGVEVMAGAPVLLMHCATQRPLCLEACKVPTDYGIELEVSCRQAVTNNKLLINELQSTGIAKGFLPKGQLTDNYWTFLNGPKVTALPEAPQLSDDGQAVFQEVVSQLRSSPGSPSLLERKMVMLENQKCEMEAAEVLLVLRQVGVSSASAEQVDLLLARFPSDRRGFMDGRAFRQALRAEVQDA